MDNLREIVLDALMSLEKEEMYSNRLIKAVLDKYDYLDARDKSFLKRVFEGTLERQLELDYYLDRFSSVPVRKMKPLVRTLLRMSAYQILYMDTVPDSAAVNEAVKLARKRKFSNLSGFVNGVCRSLSREKEAVLRGEGYLPDKKKNKAKYLSVKYSVPQWIVDAWIKEYGGEKTEAILVDLLMVHPVSVRFSTKLTQEERASYIEQFKNAGCEILPDASGLSCESIVLLDHVGNISQLPGFEEGKFLVQDISSATAVMSAGIKCGDVVVDACAAPGGKTILAAELTGDAGRVISGDLYEGKVDRILENVDRMGLTNVTASVRDASVFDPQLNETADVLLLDVPCSGLGILGKKRDIKYHVTEEGLREIEQLQRQILQASYSYVKPGGTLLYSTCTIQKGENEDQVQWILEHLPFTLEGETHQLFPTPTSDGFFYAKLVRKK